MKRVIISLFLIILIGGNIAAAATKYSYSSLPVLQESYNEKGYNLGYFTGKFYQWSLGLASLAALISIIIAGIRITASSGNVSTVSDARDQIVQALLGLALLFGAYLILYTIDPGLTSLKDPHFEKISMRAGGEYYGSLSHYSKLVESYDSHVKKGYQEGIEEYKDASLEFLKKKKIELSEELKKYNKRREEDIQYINEHIGFWHTVWSTIKNTFSSSKDKNERRKKQEEMKKRIIEDGKKSAELLGELEAVNNQIRNYSKIHTPEYTKSEREKAGGGKFKWVKTELKEGYRIVPEGETVGPNRSGLCGTPSPGPDYVCVQVK